MEILNYEGLLKYNEALHEDLLTNYASVLDINAVELDIEALKTDKVDISDMMTPDSANGHAYVDLGLPSGTLWATMNVGASSETDFGNYYKYGLGAEQYDSAQANYTGTENPLDLSVDTARQVWGGSWHMPTKAQMKELIDNTTYQWTTINGVNGGKFTAQNGNYVFIPATGSWNNVGNVGNGGHYWCSSPQGSNYAYYLSFSNVGNGLRFLSNDHREYGYSVRGVIDGPITPGSPKYATKEELTVLAGKILEKADKTDLTAKADKSEMSVVAGTGNNSDKTTITLKSGTSATVLTSHQSLSGYATELYVTTAISTQHTNDATISDVDNLIIPNNPLFSYNILDILYANSNGEKKVDSAILDPSLGYTPIGICIAGTGFFGDGEKARFQSLKYMNFITPETGSTTNQPMYLGNYDTDIPTIDNITTTHNGGTDYGYFTVDYYDSSEEEDKIPSMFGENNEWNTSVLGAANQYAATDIDGRNKTDKILATATAQSAWQTDASITNNSGANYAPAACCCARYHTLGTQASDWYLGASGEMCMIIVQKTAINAKLAQIAAVYASDSISSLVNSDHWSSTEYSSNRAYFVDTSNGLVDRYYKYNSGNVLAMLQY